MWWPVSGHRSAPPRFPWFQWPMVTGRDHTIPLLSVRRPTRRGDAADKTSWEGGRPHSRGFYYVVLRELLYFVLSYCRHPLPVPRLYTRPRRGRVGRPQSTQGSVRAAASGVRGAGLGGQLSVSPRTLPQKELRSKEAPCPGTHRHRLSFISGHRPHSGRSSRFRFIHRGGKVESGTKHTRGLAASRALL